MMLRKELVAALRSRGKTVALAGAMALGLSVGARDYLAPFYTVGFTRQGDGFINYGQSTFVTTADIRITDNRGLVSLEDFKTLQFIGSLKGAWVGGDQEGRLSVARQVEYHTDGEGKIDKIVFAVPSSNLSGMTKAVVAQVSRTSDNCISVKALMARYRNSGSNYINGKFFSMDANGNVTGLETAGQVATGEGVNGYGLVGFAATRLVPSGTPRLVFADCTLDDIRNHHFSGLGMGAWLIHYSQWHGYNVKVTEDGEGHATKLRVEMQMLDGQYVKCAVLELTNGDGGVYAVNLKSCWVESKTLGIKFANDNGTYNHNSGTPAGFPTNDGYGVFALSATEEPTTQFSPGYLDGTDRLIWPRDTLDNVFDVGGFHFSAYIMPRSEAIQGFYLRSGTGTGATLEFETRSQMGNDFRSATVTLTQKDDGVYGRIKQFGHGVGLATGPVSFLNGGTSGTTTIALAPNQNGYGAFGLQGRVVAPKALALTGETYDIAESFTTKCVRVTAEAPVTLTTSAEPSARYWDFTDAAAPVTLGMALANTSLTAGRELIVTSDALPTGTAFSVAAGNQLTLPDGQALTGNGLHSVGKVKFLGGNFTTHMRDLQSCSEVEFAGTHVFKGNDQGQVGMDKTPNGFVWQGAGRMVISGNATFTGGFNATYTTTMPGPIVITNGANVVFGDRVTVSSQNMADSKGQLEICGGNLTGGWIYALAARSEVRINIKSGMMTTAITPWVQWDPSKRVNVGQTGGLFAPTSLQPLTGNGAYDGTKSTYTLAGGTFVPPAGWTEKFPWLDIVVPVEGDATMRIDQSALLPATTTVNGTLRFASTAADATLTCKTFAGTGPIVVTEGTVRLSVPAHALDGRPFAVAENATYVKADATEQVYEAFSSETSGGSLDFSAGGAITMPAGSSIGGTLTLGATAALTLTLDPTHAYQQDEAVFTAEGGITLAEGATLNARLGTLRVSDDGTQILITPDDTTPWTATWTGLGDRTNPLDSANWSCRNMSGAALSDKCPQTMTTIVVPDGETSINVPAGSELAYYGVKFGEAVTLAADCDWRGFNDGVQLACIIDLQGHKLFVRNLNSRPRELADAIYVTDTSAGTPGELHVDVAEGTTWTNNDRDLRGNLKFVKEGAGTYQDNKQWQSYSGNTEIARGVYSAICYTFTNSVDEVVTVRSNATFVIDATRNTGFQSAPTYVLDGGTIKSANHYSANWAGLTKLKLTADSTLDCTLDFGFVGPKHTETTLDLGGHTLTVPIGTSGQNFWFYNVTATEGTVKVTNGGWFHFDKEGVRAGNTDFDLNCALDVVVPVTVRNLTQRYNVQSCALGSSTISIRGVFTPAADYVHNFSLLDGATINLGGRTTTYNTVCGSYSVKFPTTASTIAVDLHGRQLADGEKLLSWASEPSEEVKLVLDSNSRSRGIRLVRKADGLYVQYSGMVIFLR